ncbi:MAG: LCP family protein [Thermomicrobiales bacterium]|nr:LCP family protein [Thermomicrobiales bacterium]
MKRRRLPNQYLSTTVRRRGRVAQPRYPLPRSKGARSYASDVESSAAKPDLGQTMRLPAFLRAARRRQPRSVRVIATVLLLFLPLVMAIWAASVVVPIAIEARNAAGKVFVTPVEREHFADATAPPPVEPEATATSPAATGTTIAAAATSTAEPDATATQPGPTPTAYPEWDGTQPINILLLGVDAREGEEGPPRSDTMIVVRVDPVNKRVDMMSIPRDLLVEIPGYSATKINAAYPYGEVNENIPGGGPTLAAQTVEYNFGIRIDFFAEVDIIGMERVIDTLGGVIIDVPGIVKDDQYPTGDYGYTRVYFTPGLQMMDGPTAVRYSRTRHDDGDFARQQRQQQVLMAIRDRAIGTGAVTKIPELLAEVGDSVRTDLSLRQMLSLARLGQEIDQANIYSHSLAPYVEESWIDGGYYLVGDWDSLRYLAGNLPDDTNATRPMDSNQEQRSTPTPTPTASEVTPTETPTPSDQLEP